MPAVSEAAKAHRKAQKREYYLQNKERENARVKQWCAENVARSAEIKKAWRQRNPDADRAYYLANKDRKYASRDAYRRRCRQAMPSWVDRGQIITIYRRAKALGLSVDHIVPLNGENVCGLHVPWNLQLMPLRENIAKGNRYAE